MPRTAAATTRAAPRRATAYPGRVGLGLAGAGFGFFASPTFFLPFVSGPGSPPDPADTPTSGWDSTARVRTGSSSPSLRGTASTSRGGSGGGISTFSAKRGSGNLKVMAYLRLFRVLRLRAFLRLGMLTSSFSATRPRPGRPGRGRQPLPPCPPRPRRGRARAPAGPSP